MKGSSRTAALWVSSSRSTTARTASNASPSTPAASATDLARNMPEATHAYLTDAPDLTACFAVWLCSGQADWAKGRYLSATWDVGEIEAMKEEILRDDLLVNRLRATS